MSNVSKGGIRKSYTGKRRRTDGPVNSSSGLQSYRKKPRTNPYYNPTPYGSRNVKKGVDSVFRSGATAPDFDTANIISNFTNNDFVFPINLIQAGSGSWNRVGRLVTMKSVRVRGSILTIWTPQATNQQFSRVLRMLIVYDKQPNGAIPIKSSIIQTKN